MLWATDPAPGRPLPASNLEMAALLENLASTADPAGNEYLNAERARGLRQQLAGSLAGSAGPEAEIAAGLALSAELLRAGLTEEAIAELERLRGRAGEVSEPRSRKLSRRLLLDMLGISYLRLGEQQNCLVAHTSASCILPIAAAGVHARPLGSRTAISHFGSLLSDHPDDLGSLWLANLAYMTLGEHPHGVPDTWLIPPETFASDGDAGRFRDVAPHSGLAAAGLSGGSVMEDFDGDGFLDVMASSWGLRDPLRLFRSNGDGSFDEHTERAGLAGQVGGLNLTHADFDNDGDRDVLVLRGAWLDEHGLHPNSLLENDSRGFFTDATRSSGLLSFHPTHSASWGDYDNDGWLDLYVGNESRLYAFGTAPSSLHPNQLFHSNGDGTFTDRAGIAGVDLAGYVKGVAWGDYDNDGLLDLYVSILHSDNVLFRNNLGEWTDGGTTAGPGFVDVTAAAGVAGPQASFPTWFWDYDNDGWLDLFAAAFEFESAADIVDLYFDNPSVIDRPRLYRNEGNGTFTDATRAAGMHRAIAAMGANFGDLDNDGFLDCYIGTGHPQMRALLPNRMFRNAGGAFFEDVTTSGGFGHLQKGHAVSFGDIDNDGDQDIYQVIGGAFSGDVYQDVLFENPGHGNSWLTLQLEGVRSNRDGIGAVITAHVREHGRPRRICLTAGTGGSFGSSSLQQEIGLGSAEVVERLEIAWPSGTRQIFPQVEVNRFLKIVEDAAEPVLLEKRRFAFR